MYYLSWHLWLIIEWVKLFYPNLNMYVFLYIIVFFFLVFKSSSFFNTYPQFLCLAKDNDCMRLHFKPNKREGSLLDDYVKTSEHLFVLLFVIFNFLEFPNKSRGGIKLLIIIFNYEFPGAKYFSMWGLTTS